MPGVGLVQNSGSGQFQFFLPFGEVDVVVRARSRPLPLLVLSLIWKTWAMWRNACGFRMAWHPNAAR